MRALVVSDEDRENRGHDHRIALFDHFRRRGRQQDENENAGYSNTRIEDSSTTNEGETMKTVAYASAMCAVASTVALAALVVLLASSPGAAAELISTPAAQPAEDVGDGWCV